MIAATSCGNEAHPAVTNRTAPALEAGLIRAISSGVVAGRRDLDRQQALPLVRDIEGWRQFLTDINDSWLERTGPMPSPDCAVFLRSDDGGVVALFFADNIAFRGGTSVADGRRDVSAARPLSADERELLNELMQGVSCTPSNS
jgi:hypothetical protein